MHHLTQLREARMHDAKARIDDLCCSGNCLRVAIQRQQCPVLAQAREDGAAVAAAAEGAVDVGTGSLDVERIDRLAQQNR